MNMCASSRENCGRFRDFGSSFEASCIFCIQNLYMMGMPKSIWVKSDADTWILISTTLSFEASIPDPPRRIPHSSPARPISPPLVLWPAKQMGWICPQYWRHLEAKNRYQLNQGAKNKGDFYSGSSHWGVSFRQTWWSFHIETIYVTGQSFWAIPILREFGRCKREV